MLVKLDNHLGEGERNYVEYEIRMISISQFLGTGDIDFDEFCTLMARMMGLDDDEPEAEEVHKEAFKLLDHKGSGHISATDFREILGSLSEKLSNSEINSIIQEIDPDHDDKINFQGW